MKCSYCNTEHIGTLQKHVYILFTFVIETRMYICAFSLLRKQRWIKLTCAKNAKENPFQMYSALWEHDMEMRAYLKRSAKSEIHLAKMSTQNGCNIVHVSTKFPTTAEFNGEDISDANCSKNLLFSILDGIEIAFVVKFSIGSVSTLRMPDAMKFTLIGSRLCYELGGREFSMWFEINVCMAVF